ncbi:hypothetical protein KC717_01620 [Candidatus Dojkabacteria bacterium]|uniref:Uncharacterized protein n=1 Tax=Candidatus Dojkabacteria bacterium TaxID=2099670 RepID=A0A955L820_9BACT|nr:hypothetical protein [Candidatus Dojkabacteria bacterium]
MVYSKQELDKWKECGYYSYIRSTGEEFKIPYSLVEDCRRYDGFEAAEDTAIPTLIIRV